MKESAWTERNRKRERRMIYRNKRLEYEQSKRSFSRKEKDVIEARIGREVRDALKADNKKSDKSDKKPETGKFLAFYSFIPCTPYDSRYSIPSSWKPQSFNKRKQHLEFLKSFVYPYPLPETLLWASHAAEYIPDSNGGLKKSYNFPFIHLAKNWINDIISGGSFFKLNKKFFTKAEAHYFLSSKLPYTNPESVLKLYFYAKSRARAMNHKLSMLIADVFTIKFQKHFRNSVVEGFLELLARTPEYGYESGMLGDISDFVLSKIDENKKNKGKHEAFSFGGRTISSVVKLANEWHGDVRREAEAERVQQAARWRERQGKEKNIDISHWKGMNISQFRYETEEFAWTVTELKTAQDLLNEGRKMKNCVASYTHKCASGDSAIFSLERIYPVGQIIEKAATLEVSLSSRTLIQAKGKCNSRLTPKTMSVVIRWAQANSIKIGVLV